MRRLLFAATLALLVPGNVYAQYCVGVPTTDGEYALESHYLRTPGLSGVGLTATADRAGPLSLRASLSRAASSTALTGGAVWELPSISWSGCPIAIARYRWC
ncbi:MAG TPA: hypothetical protein VK928_02110 [Longimicrobiales bacterium]|nr:hypothetical protein [Longimicrobiales bacterium]